MSCEDVRIQRLFENNLSRFAGSMDKAIQDAVKEYESLKDTVKGELSHIYVHYVAIRYHNGQFEIFNAYTGRNSAFPVPSVEEWIRDQNYTPWALMDIMNNMPVLECG